MGKSQEATEELIVNTMRRLQVYDKLQRKNTSEIGWIAFAFSCSASKAEKLVKAARARMAEEGAA